MTLRTSPGASLLSWLAPITSFRLAAVTLPSTQCAAVSTQTEETSVAPQNAKLSDARFTETKKGYAPTGATVPPTMSVSGPGIPAGISFCFSARDDRRIALAVAAVRTSRAFRFA